MHDFSYVFAGSTCHPSTDLCVKRPMMMTVTLAASFSLSFAQVGAAAFLSQVDMGHLFHLGLACSALGHADQLLHVFIITALRQRVVEHHVVRQVHPAEGSKEGEVLLVQPVPGRPLWAPGGHPNQLDMVLHCLKVCQSQHLTTTHGPQSWCRGYVQVAVSTPDIPQMTRH